MAITEIETGEYVEVNESFLQVLGFTREEAIGKTSVAINVFDERQRAVWMEKLKKEGYLRDFEVTVCDKSGKKRYGLFSAEYIQLQDHKLLLTVMNDITERVQVEEKLRLNEARYRHISSTISDIAYSCVMDANGDFGIDWLSGAVEQITGYTADALIEMRCWGHLVTDEDFHLFQKFVIGLAPGENGECELRIRHKNGEIHWLNSNAECVQEGEGRRLYGGLLDITERKQAEQALRESELHYRIVADNTHDWEFWQSPDGRFLYTSPSCKHVIGHEADEFLRDANLLLRIIHRDDVAMFLEHRDEVAQKKESGECEFRIVLPDGSIRWIGHVCQPVFDGQGNYLGTRGSNRDITFRKYAEIEMMGANEQMRIHVKEIMQLQAELREQALRDPTTNLYNRRYLSDTLERDLARMKREKKPLSVIMMDIDHFKIVNDTYGHQMGDQFLVKIAEIILSHTRGSDIACRYGGEEFLLVMPGASPRSALKRAEEIRQACADIRIPYKKKSVKVTLSLGVAAYPAHGKTSREIIENADVALYHSKHSGRNKATIWGQ
jgi:diguanylate cyclase (GGDEF)-like protein/PAS domain S-box-containing protein